MKLIFPLIAVDTESILDKAKKQVLRALYGGGK